MQTTAIIVWIYGALVLVGGVMGWMKAKSKPSLYTGIAFGAVLIFCGFLLYQNDRKALIGTITPTVILLGIMITRFQATRKFMPAGLVAVLSLIVLIVLVLAMVHKG